MIKNKKIKSFSEGAEAFCSRTKFKDRHIAQDSTMSTDTKDFIRKVCYRQTASIDMTQYGFITDSKINPVNLVIKPLKEQLEKIRVKPSKHGHLPTPSPSNVPEVDSLPKLKPPCIRNSALSNPGTHSTRAVVRKVRIQSDRTPSPVPARSKKVTLLTNKKQEQGKVIIDRACLRRK